MNNNQNHQKELIPAREVSRILSIPLRTVQRLSQEGKIKAIKIGNRWKYYKSDILKHRNYGTTFANKPIRILHTKEINQFTERRIHPRINCSIPCDIKVIIPDKKEIITNARILNISEGGTFIESINDEENFKQIKNDDPIKIKFKLVGQDPLETNGRILRKQHNGLAIKFRLINYNTKQQIKEYIG